MSGRLILVSSYPKSGNTWTRAVLEQVRRGPGWTFSINEMPSGFYSFHRRVLFDAVSPVNAGDLFLDEIENMMPEILRLMVDVDPNTHIMKVHDSARRNKSGEWLYPPDAVYSLIYLVRHPFDVAVSSAHHLGIGLADAVALMADSEIVSHYTDQLPLALPQHTGSWTSNIASWLGGTPYRVALARYEDLHADPVAGFGRLARAAGFAVPEAQLAQAVAATAFDKMRDQEKKQGFRERPHSSPAFFRAGQPRSWDAQLDRELADRLVRDHGRMMEQLGYLPDGGIAPMPQAGIAL